MTEIGRGKRKEKGKGKEKHKRKRHKYNFGCFTLGSPNSLFCSARDEPLGPLVNHHWPSPSASHRMMGDSVLGMTASAIHSQGEAPKEPVCGWVTGKRCTVGLALPWGSGRAR